MLSIRSREYTKGKFAKHSPINGYTLIEMLLAFNIFMLISLFLLAAISFLRSQEYGANLTTEMTWTLFVQQTKKELFTAQQIELSDEKIEFVIERGKQLETVSYEKYNNLLRRRVNQSGHEVLLFHVKAFKSRVVPGGIELEIQHENGDIFEIVVYLPQTIPIITE